MLGAPPLDNRASQLGHVAHEVHLLGGPAPRQCGVGEKERDQAPLLQDRHVHPGLDTIGTQTGLRGSRIGRGVIKECHVASSEVLEVGPESPHVVAPDGADLIRHRRPVPLDLYGQTIGGHYAVAGAIHLQDAADRLGRREGDLGRIFHVA